MTRALLQQALDVLLDSVDLVSNSCQEHIDLYSKYPTRAEQINGLIAGVRAHEDAIGALRTELAKGESEPVAWVGEISEGAQLLLDKPMMWEAIPLFTKDES